MELHTYVRNVHHPNRPPKDNSASAPHKPKSGRGRKSSCVSTHHATTANTSVCCTYQPYNTTKRQRVPCFGRAALCTGHPTARGHTTPHYPVSSTVRLALPLINLHRKEFISPRPAAACAQILPAQQQSRAACIWTRSDDLGLTDDY